MRDDKKDERKFQIEMLRIRLSFSQVVSWTTVFLSIAFSVWISSNTTIGLTGLWDTKTFLLFNIGSLLLIGAIIVLYLCHLGNVKNRMAKLEKDFIELNEKQHTGKGGIATNKKHLQQKDKQVLLELYKAQWNDIYGLDSLDWRVALMFIPLIGALSFIYGIAWEHLSQEISVYTDALRAISLIVYLISLYGLWTVTKGQAHVTIKFQTLDKIEKDLGWDSYGPKRHVGALRRAVTCRRFLLFLVYLFLGLLCFSMVITPIIEWKFHSSIFNNQLMVIPLCIALLIFVIHLYDYYSYRYYCYPGGISQAIKDLMKKAVRKEKEKKE